MTLKHPGYLSVTQVAELFAVSKMHIHRMIRRGDLEAIRIGGRIYRIPEAEVRKFLPPEPGEPAGSR